MKKQKKNQISSASTLLFLWKSISKRIKSVKIIIGENMEKKRLISIGIIVFLLLVGILTIILINNRTVLTITLDINPSMEIHLGKNEKVRNIIALNEDAKELINKDLNGKSIEEVFGTIAEKVIKKDYIEDGKVIILISFKGKENKEKINEVINKSFQEKKFATEIIVIENITKEDEKFAKKNHITPAKAAYIQSITKENEKISTTSLLDKSIKELQETQKTGRYCEEGYHLEGHFCSREIGVAATSTGKICPTGYYEYEEKCYLEVPSEEGNELVCREGFLLEDNQCIHRETASLEEEYTCERGELLRKGDVSPVGAIDNDKMYCIDKSTGQEPTLRCLTINHIMIEGKCYVGPAPVINGGCLNGDPLVNGGCYSPDDGDQWVCPNGQIYEKSKDIYVDLCPDTFTYLEPTITGYTCPKDFTQEEDQCVKIEKEETRHNKYCPTGYTMLENERCIDQSQTAEKEDGLVCLQENTRLKDNQCILYETIDAKHS